MLYVKSCGVKKVSQQIIFIHMKANDDWIFTQSINNHKKFVIFTVVCSDHFNINADYVLANSFNDFVIQSCFFFTLVKPFD